MKRSAADLVLYAYIAMVVLIMLLGISGLFMLVHYKNRTQSTYDTISLRTQLAETMRDVVRDRTTRMHRIVLFTKPAERAQEIKQYEHLLARYQQASETLGALLHLKTERDAYDNMVKLAEHGWRMQAETLRLLAEGDEEAALAALLGAVMPVQDEVLEQFGTFNELQRLQAVQLHDELQRQFRITITLGIGAALFTLLATGILTLELRRRVARLEASAEESAHAMQRYAEKLEDSVAARTRELSSARDEAVRANQAKSLFLANTSHELRTPLSAIIGYCEMMQEEAADHDEKALVTDLCKMRHAALHLLELIDNILDFSKTEAGRMPLVIQGIALDALIDEVFDAVRPLAEKNGDQLHLVFAERATQMETDRTKLFHILLNLLANACKFTEHGDIRVSVDRTKEEDWRFKVEDNGIGIPADKLSRIFEPFIQADASTTRRYGGTGLGLTLAKDYANLLGGRIEVDSTPGRGSCFTLYLPAKPAPRGIGHAAGRGGQ